MPDRFFCDLAIEGTNHTLSGSEAHHLLHVLRAKPGLEVVLFDGRGGEWSATICRLGRSEVELTLNEFSPLERELSCQVTLGVTLPKGDRQRWLVEKCVELGVTRLVPLATSRSSQHLAEAPQKLARYVVEASKQCGRNRLMDIAPPLDWAAFVTQCTEPVRLIAHPGGAPFKPSGFPSKQMITLAVGPEGGFTTDEIALAQDADWKVVGLGARILRIETAALALVARVTT